MSDKYPLVAETTTEGSAEPTPEQRATVLRVIQDLIDLYSGTPVELRETIVVSFFVTLCMNDPEPKSTFAMIGQAVAEGIDEFLAEQGKH